MNKFLVVNQPEKWPVQLENISIIAAQDYLTNPLYAKIKNARIRQLRSSTLVEASAQQPP